MASESAREGGADVAPRAAALLPTWNGERDLERLLPALGRQKLTGGLRVLAIDSDSTDRTQVLLRTAKVAFEVIPQSEFGHGRTRNQLARSALALGAEFLVFLSQDAEPCDEHCLHELLEPFADPAVVGTYARILPRPDDDPLTRRTVLSAPEASEQPRLHTSAEEASFNNVASAMRASWFTKHPFPEVPFGEDLAWARAALVDRGRIAFAPKSVVWHAHAYGPGGAFARYRTDAGFRAAATGVRVRPHLGSVCKGIAYEVRADWRYLKSERVPGRFMWMLRSVALRSAQVWGQYLGGALRNATAPSSAQKDTA